jgi:hypothetical protein
MPSSPSEPPTRSLRRSVTDLIDPPDHPPDLAPDFAPDFAPDLAAIDALEIRLPRGEWSQLQTRLVTRLAVHKAIVLVGARSADE